MKGFIYSYSNGIIFACLLLFLSAHSSYSQPTASSNGFAFPSANNSFLGTSVPGSPGLSVDLYTGTAQAGVSVCDLPSTSLDIPVSLSYVSGRGVRVQDYASFVGLGWQLNAGGGISRVVRGFPDEFADGYLGTNQWGAQLQSPLSNNVMITSGSQNPGPQFCKITGYCGGFSNPSADGEPDIFYVKTPYFSFQFIFGPDGNPVVSDYTGVQIISHNFYNTSSYSGSWFEAIDDKGNQYYFGNANNSVEQSSTSLFGTTYQFPTTWYLTKIVTLNSSDVVNLTYTNATNNDVTSHYRKTRNYDNNFNYQGGDSTTLTTTVIQPKYVSTITSALGELDFAYVYDRQDDAAAARLAGITKKFYDPMTGAATTLNTYNFAYSYCNPAIPDPNYQRLKLEFIYMTDNNLADFPLVFASFGYNTAIELPSRTSDAFDYFGYYTQLGTQDPLTPFAAYGSRQSNLNYCMADVLTSVNLLTGGSWQIGYELNQNGSVSTGGLRVHTLTKQVPGGQAITTTYSYLNNSGYPSGQVLNSNYSLLTFQIGSWYQVYSETPANIFDLNGIFIGYSQVTVTDPNGGTTLYQFKNFSDFNDQSNNTNLNNYDYNGVQNVLPDIPAVISYAYKRGLPTYKSVKDASGNLISEATYNYAAQTSPVQQKAWAYHWYTVSEAGLLTYGAQSTYYTNVENYRLTQVIQNDHDQNNPTAYTTRTINYTYSTINSRLVKTTATTDSRGLPQSETVNYADDVSSLSLPAGEQNAVSTLMGAGCTSAVIQTVDIRNTTPVEKHNSFANVSYGAATNVYLAGSADYFNSSVTRQQQFLYDPASSHQVAAEQVGSKPASVQYGYNGAYPVAKVVNATNTVSYDPGTGLGSGTFLWNPGVFNSQNATFTQLFASNITLSGGFSEYPGSDTYTFNYTLQGPVNSSGTLCVAGQGASCSFPSSVTLTNMPAGQYTVTIFPNSDFSIGASLTYTWQASQQTDAGPKEFFYEGFEQNNLATAGSGHTGNYYYNGNYAVNFTIPNSRSYVIQWWSRVGTTWHFNEQPYTGSTTLTGPVDDVRIFPADAQMTTYTYQPLVGMTSETDPAGRTTYYTYDPFGRPNTVFDLNGNVLKTFSYSDAGAPTNVPLILGTTFGAPVHGVYLYYISTGNCGSVVVNWTEQGTGKTGNQSGSCGSPMALQLPDAFQTYNITVTCYPPGPPTSSVTSSSISVYMPF